VFAIKFDCVMGDASLEPGMGSDSHLGWPSGGSRMLDMRDKQRTALRRNEHKYSNSCEPGCYRGR